jgi:acyl-CoA thioesterase FadM
LNEGDEEPERVRRRRRFQRRNKEWLKHATSHFVQTKPGSLTVGKWNEVISIFTAWSAYAKYDYEAPLQMEALLKVLVEERRAGNESVELSMELYNLLLDTWACAALFRTGPVEQASQRSRELLVMLQENYEQELASVGGDEAAVSAPKPDEESFDVVLHVVCRTEGALVARRLLAWMEFLHKSGRNVGAKPTRSDYIQVLDAYAKQGINPGQLAEGFLRHLKCTARHLQLPDTLCYNIAIKAWMNESKLNRRAGCRQAAEHADRIMEEMKQAGNESCRPDLVTYSCKYRIY